MHRRFAIGVLLLLLVGACSSGNSTGASPTTVAPATTAAPASTVAPATTAVPSTAAPTTAAPVTTLAPVTTAPPTTTTGFEPPVVGGEWPSFRPLPGTPGIAALTGVATVDEVAARSIVAVKIDNAPAARPQWALDDADVVFEENVESLTRFIALYQTRLPELVGPVRSVRTSDLPVLAALNRPIVGWSGGNPGVMAAVSAAAGAGVLVDAGTVASSWCYHREPGRPAPHNLAFNPNCARDSWPDAGPARPIFSFGAPATGAGDGHVFGVAMDGVRADWGYDEAGGGYLRWQNGVPHLTASGAQVGAVNVVVLRVAYLPSPVDERSPEAQTVGAGPMTLLRGGLRFDGEWYRPSPFSPFRFRVGDTELLLAPGTTFVELARTGA